LHKHQFQQLIDKYLKGQATAQEEQLLMELFESLQTNADWNEQQLGVKHELEDKMLNRLQQAIINAEPEPERKVLKLFAFRNIAAAMVAFVVISAGVYYNLQQNSKDPQVAKKQVAVRHDVDPGKNKAILTLDNGEQVVLDSARVGTIAKKGNISVQKTSGGQVIYTVDGQSSSTASNTLTYNTISTPRGGQYQVVLPDGTKVWLNAASSLKFPTAFAGNERKVELTGEAYFEVTKNPSKPFRVSVNALDVKVLGTHFNIMAYGDEDAIKTTLLEGSVQLNLAGSSSMLKPDQQGVIHNGNIRVVEVNAEREVAWKNGFFEFNRCSLLDIMRQLSRWYDIEVVYQGKTTDDEFVGKIERNVKLSQVLRVLQLNRVHFKVEDKKIFVSP
jgi:transmembrane sensor